MSFKTIQLDIADDVALLTLDRPDKLNSFTTAMHAELREALRAVRKAKARALVLTGAGRAFCAGQDLGDANIEDGIGDTLEKNYNPLVHTLRRLPMPVLVAVNGVAAGAGANIALAGDLVYAGRSASFIQAFVKIGLVPDAGGSHALVQRIGVQRALGLAITGDKLDAETAESWGLIWKCVDDDVLMSTVMDQARHLATQPTRAIGLIKRLFNAAPDNDLEAQLGLEAQMQRLAGSGEDYREGIQAFLDKRKPIFTGQ
ncbi:MAG: 2-(1,2-epoxy-1,2-dihydrophenyl)acetyl-CoA isomerase PaaG [Alphaproteobacteria bacterium]